MIACAHGTDNPLGRAEINRLREQIASLRPGLRVLEAYVDVQRPSLEEVLAGLPGGVPAVVVPLLLSVGYHVEVDIPRAVAGRARTTAAAPLGPDPRLAEVLAERLRALPGFDREWGVVLAAAGSSKPGAAKAVEITAKQLGALISQPVLAAFGASAEPKPPAAVEHLRRESAKVAIASYLLAPGFFHDQLARAGADAVSAPLLPAPVIAQIALDRYDAVANQRDEEDRNAVPS
nr:CbiX/SirB N-terminal domain-containing protein [Psychromicrobium silvestre]